MYENGTRTVDTTMLRAIESYERNLGNTISYIFFGSLTVIGGLIYMGSITFHPVIRKKVNYLTLMGLLLGETVYSFGMLIKASIVLSNGPVIMTAHACYWVLFPRMLGAMIIESMFALSTLQWYRNVFVPTSKSALYQLRLFWLAEATVAGLVGVTVLAGHYVQVPYADVVFCNRKALESVTEKVAVFLQFPSMLELVVVLQVVIWIWLRGRAVCEKESTSLGSITQISESAKEKVLLTIFICSIVYLAFCATAGGLATVEMWKPEIFKGMHAFECVFSLHGMTIYIILALRHRELRTAVRHFLKLNRITDDTTSAD